MVSPNHHQQPSPPSQQQQHSASLPRKWSNNKHHPTDHTPHRTTTTTKTGFGCARSYLLGHPGLVVTPNSSHSNSPIAVLPVELLSHVFAHLSPSELNTSQLVSKSWNEIIKDEGSWRTAFEMYYGTLRGRNLPSEWTGSTTRFSLGRRIEPNSWRTEYVTRVNLLSRWSKSRTPSITHDPHLGPPSLSILSPTLSPVASSTTTTTTTTTTFNLLSISLPLSRAVLSHPFSGLLSKALISPLHTPAGLNHHNHQLHFHLPNPDNITTTACAVSPSGDKVVWGLGDGRIRVGRSAALNGVNERAWEDFEPREVQVQMGPGAAHRREVSLIGFSQRVGKVREDLFVSVGKEGAVIVWSLEMNVAGLAQVPMRERGVARKVWTVNIPSSSSSGETILGMGTGTEVVPTTLVFDAGWKSARSGRRSVVAIGMSDGRTHVWAGIDFDVDVEGDVLGGLKADYWLVTNDGAVSTLVLDHSTNSTSFSLLIHSTKSSTFSRYDFPPSSSSSSTITITRTPRRTTYSHHSSIENASFTTFATDFSSPPPVPPTSFPPSSSTTATTADQNGSNRARWEGIPQLPHSTSLASLDDVPVNHGGVGISRTDQSFGGMKYLATGDSIGRVFLWEWPEVRWSGDDIGEGGEEEEKGSQVKRPSMQIGGIGSRVTAIGLAEVVIAVGTLDGTVRVYDTLTSTLLRTFKDRSASRTPSRLLAAGGVAPEDEDRWKVSSLWATKDSIVAAIGGKVLAWKVKGLGVGDGKKKKARAGRMSARTERFRSEVELRQEVRESLSSLEAESEMEHDRVLRDRHITNQYGLPASLSNMTEEEAIAFAMMLSVDDQEERMFSSAAATPPFGAIQDDLDFEGLSLDNTTPDTRASRSFGNRPTAADDLDHLSDEDDDEPRSPSGGSYSRSLSIPTSPYIRGSSLGSGSPSPSRSTFQSWRPASQHSSPSLSPYHSQTSSKVQLSPRLGPTYGDAAMPSGPVPDMSEELWPLASTSTSPPATTPATPSPKPLIRKGWNEVARSASATPSPSPSPRVGKAQSLLTSQLTGFPAMGTTSPSPVSGSRALNLARQEEEELRLAIELSLAEERSLAEQ